MIPSSYQLNMNLHHLHYFYIVAREGGFRRASDLLRIQQPAISKMVGQLEEHFGFPLFEKVGRGVQLTQAGQDVFEQCHRIFGEVETLRRSLGEISGEPHGPLDIGTTDVVAGALLPRAFKRIMAKYPKLYPVIQTGPAYTLFPKISQRKVEFGLFFHIPALPESLECSVFARIPFKLVVKRGYEKDKQVIASFIGSREVDDQSNRRFPTLERIARDVKEAAIKISSNSLLAHKEFVLNGLGVSVLPEFLVAQELKTGKLVSLYDREKFEFDLKMIYLRGFQPSLNARLLIDDLKSLFKTSSFASKMAGS